MNLGPITKYCPYRSHCLVDCASGGPVPRVPECNYWADHLKKEASSREQLKDWNIEYQFNRENKMPSPECEVCGKKVPDYKPQFCCSSFDCGCQGLPIHPCICSNECWDKLLDNKNERENRMNPKVGLTKHRRPFPIGDRMIVEEMKEEISAGGIVLPPHIRDELKQREQVETRFLIGKILALGEGSFTDAGVLIPIPLKVGDIIAYADHQALQYKIDGETFTLLQFCGVAARISSDSYPEPE